MVVRTDQELFDYVVGNIVKQGGPSISVMIATRFCMYRGDAGRKCGAGWLIPDEKYHIDIEGSGIDSYNVRGLIEMTSDQTRLVASLQRAHDYVDIDDGNTGLVPSLSDADYLIAFKKKTDQLAAQAGLENNTVWPD